MEPFTPTRVQLESLTSEVENYFEKKFKCSSYLVT